MGDDITKISELPHRDNPHDDDYVLVNRGDKSYKMSYKNLKTVLVSSISADMNIGSMATRNKEEFSKFAHGHDYSYIDFFPKYRSDDYTRLGTIIITRYGSGDSSTQRNIDVRAPIPSQQTDRFKAVCRKVGEIQILPVCNFNHYLTQYRGYKLVRIGGKTNIDINDDSFDGWVIPNGVTYNCTSDTFRDACLNYSTTKTAGADSFHVPCIDRFLRMNNNSDDELNGHENQSHEFVNQIHSHLHGHVPTRIPIECDQAVANLPIGATSSLNGEYFEGKNCSSRDGVTSISGTIQSISGGKVTFGNVLVQQSDASLDIETYPSHVLMPVLIYIGKR